MSRIAKKALAIVLACSMAFAFTPVAGKSDAKAKKPSLKTKNVVTIVGESEKNTVKANGNVVKSVTWKLKNNKYVSFKKSGKLSAKFTGKKVGSTKATATVKYKKTKKSKKTSKVTLKFIVDVEGGEDGPVTGAWENNTDHAYAGVYDIDANDVLGISNAIYNQNPDIVFKPLAIVGYQVVEGLNCRVVGIYSNKKENSEPVYAIFQLLNTALDDKWEVSAEGFLKSQVPACEDDDAELGSWKPCLDEDMNITDTVKTSIKNALGKAPVVLTFEPSAILAKQEGVGTNRVTVGWDYAEDRYYIVFTSFSNENGDVLGAEYGETERSIEDFEVYTYEGTKVDID